MADQITVGCLRRILVDGERVDGSIRLQIIGMKKDGNKLQMHLSDTLNMVLVNNVMVSNPSDFLLYAIVQIDNYKLQPEADVNEKFVFGEVCVIVVDSSVEEIIGQPMCFDDNSVSEVFGKENISAEMNYSGFEHHALQSLSVLNSTFPLSSAERKERLTWQQEYLWRMKEELGKAKLKKTKLLIKQKQIEINLKQYSGEMALLVNKMGQIHEKVRNVNGRLEAIEKKMMTIREKVEFYSKQ